MTALAGDTDIIPDGLPGDKKLVCGQTDEEEV